MNSLLDCCFRTTRWVPVVFIVGVIGWSYYAYVFELLYKTIPAENMAEKVLLGILYHPVLFIFLWAYYKIVYTDPKGPPLQFYLTENQLAPLREAEMRDDREKGAELLEQYARHLPVRTRTYKEGVRYCEVCNCLKPDRAHHCSVCKKCVLKMDHHCPWVNNCVCFNNYKFFVLFLLYAEIYCLYIALSDVKYFIQFWTKLGQSSNSNFHVMFLFIVAVMFSCSVAGLLGYHIYLTLRNQSTLESFRPPILHNTGPVKDAWTLGKSANWREVFGDDSKKWFLPVYTAKGDGVRFTTKMEAKGQGYSALENGEVMSHPNGVIY